MNKILNYINGTYVAPKSNEWIDNYNPSNGEIYGKIPNSSSEDVEAAYQAAKAAFPSWSSTTLDERSRILSKIADLIQENLADLAHAESLDNGKPLSLATQIDIPRATSNFKFFSQAITQFSSEDVYFTSHKSVQKLTF